MRRYVRFWLAKFGSQSIPELAVDLGRPHLHQQMRAADGPAHQLLLRHPFAHERIHR